MAKLFTSESVSEGHPDKICDQISDAILDAALRRHERSRVACEALVKDDLVVIAGEITIPGQDADRVIDYDAIVLDVIRGCGYNDEFYGFDIDKCRIEKHISAQSGDIGGGVDREGAGDQGMMFGYATDETDTLMPAPIHYAHRLVKRHAELRRSGGFEWLGPDAKGQLTFEYDDDNRPRKVRAVVFSTQHSAGKEREEIASVVRHEIAEAVLPKELLDDDTPFHINPTGSFVAGGPAADCGLTGRKIIVDTYGGMARHGGGAFSGKDPSKVDRSAAYAARHVAKNVVAAGLARRCEVQVSYAIGVAEPTSVSVDTFGTGALPDREIDKLIRQNFDLTPKRIIEGLRLLRPVYRQTAAYGHFGREGEDFTWEHYDKADGLKNAT